MPKASKTVLPPGKKTIRVGRCIYCGATDDLRIEHAIPESLQGDLLLEAASCRQCEDITKKFEGRYCGETLKPFRDFWKFKSKRRNRGRLSSFPMRLKREGVVIHEAVSKADYMPVIPLWELGHPERFAHVPHSKGLAHGEARLIVFNTRSQEDLIEIADKFDIDELQVDFPLYIDDFLRLIAKIAYCFAVAKFGLSSFGENYLLPGILGNSNDLIRFVGSEGKQLLYHEGLGTQADHLVSVGIDSDGIIGAQIKLFKDLQTPEYLVIVGRVSAQYLAILGCAGYPVSE